MNDARHLTDEDLVRVLAFDPADRDVAPLEAHAASCSACALRLREAAELEILCVETAAVREKPRRPRITSRRAALFAMGGALAVAATVVIGLSPHARDAIAPEPGVLPMGAPATAADDAWFIAGSTPARFVRSIEIDRTRASGRARVLASSAPAKGPNDFGTLMQTFSATKFRGQRIRLSADVRTSDVSGWAGLWMRVDRNGNSVAFDNMAGREIRGTTSWSRYEIVLDVVKDADAISLGLLVNGEGSAAIADPRVDIVGPDVPVTIPSPRPLRPDFAE